MSYLRHLCLFAHSDVYQILCCVLFFFVLLSVSLECPFFNALLAIIYYDLLNNTKAESSNPVHGEMYLIQHYMIKVVSDLR